MIFMLFIRFLWIPMLYQQKVPEEKPVYTVMFYNTENLFDTFDDATTVDEDFTPAGNMHWTCDRYYHKLNNLCKVIITCGGWDFPDIVGLCEVENRQVLNDLIYQTPLSKFSLGVVQFDSPDKRGIDAVMIYNRKTVKVVQRRSISIRRPDLMTRDILYVKALLAADTCHIFINHWPSRSSGQLETEGGRNSAALILKHSTDSLFRQDPLSAIIIMGDFNDDPSDISIMNGLCAVQNFNKPADNRLYNLAKQPKNSPVGGTLKYQGSWNLFDQVMVSGNLLAGRKGLRVSANSFRILDSYFLLEKDETYTGYKPFRTYSGFKYMGGFSDHLPVTVNLVRQH